MNKNTPLISVIVPIFNRLQLVPRTLQSLQNQSYKNIEVICVNDGGEYAGHIIESLNDPRFKYYEHGKNKGLPAARNTALRHATGTYLCLLDSDDIYLQYALEFRMYMIKKLGVDIVYTRALQNIADKIELPDGRINYQIVHRQLYWDSEFDRDQILVMNISPCCCPLFSRKSWENTGYWYDETLSSSEDFDFWCSLSRKYDFHNLGMVDCECLYTRQADQMTGNIDFSNDIAKVYKRWRDTAINKDWVKQNQNSNLKNRGLNPEDFGL